MLVLSRMAGQEIVITVEDTEIRVIVREIKSDKVRLGFIAPSAVTVDRLEVHEARQRPEQQPK